MEEMFVVFFIGMPMIVCRKHSVILPNSLVTFLAFFLLTSLTFSSTNLTDLARKVEEMAVSGSRITPQEQKLAEEIRRIGAPAIPVLLSLLQHNKRDVRELTSYIFEKLGAEAESAVDPLVQIALDVKIDSKVRIAAVEVLGNIGLQARRSIPTLRQLADQSPRIFQNTVDEAIIRMGGPEAGQILTKRLSERPEESTFVRLAELGENGRNAGPVLVRLLDHKDWDIRVYAARCLGFIGYTNAGPHLIELLKNPDDWQLVFVSIESLRLLQERAALPVLAVVSQSHWYSPVREAASAAIRAIGDKPSHEPEQRSCGSEFGLRIHQFWTYKFIRADTNTFAYEHEWQEIFVGAAKIFNPSHLWLMRLRYEVKETAGYPGRQYSRTKTVVPDVSIRVDNGYVVGRNRGEFGGELMFIGKDGKSTLLLQENVSDIHRMVSGIVAVTGLAHMFSNEGGLFRISKDDEGWKAVKWKVLPGAPLYSRMLKDGDLFVACVDGCIRVSSVGDIRMADEHDQQTVRGGVLANSLWRIALLLGGLVLVPLCALALLFPYFRFLPYRFTQLGMTVIPFALIISFFASAGFLGHVSLLLPLITVCLFLSCTPNILSMISIVRQSGYSRRRKIHYVIFDILQVTGYLWAFGMFWMVIVIMRS